MENIKVGRIDDIKKKRIIHLTHNNKEIMVVDVNGNIYAISDICTHAGANLHEGRLDGNKVICPWHSAVWDVTNGKLIEFPVKLKELESYKVSIRDGVVYISI
ncbi:MAG: Rieske 2Fe-2S domain-containing protein [Candidatus Nitrosocaldaceae archaeon]